MTRIVFPNIPGCSIDPLHLAFSEEQSTWKLQKPNELHWYIRRILSKFGSPEIGDDWEGDMYRGGFLHTGPDGEIARDRALSPCVSITCARRALRTISTKIGFKSRGEFCGYPPDAVESSPHLAKNRTWSKKPARRRQYMECKAGATSGI